jgi:uncharacterized metal-binding protein
MVTPEFKVAILVCNGIGRLASTIVRQAGYLAHQQRPEETVLLAVGPSAVDEEQSLEALKKYPVVAIDGCRPHCASYLMKQKKKKPAAVVYVGDVLADTRISLVGEKRTGLGEKGKQLVQAVAERVVKEVDRAIADEMVSTL